VDLCDESFFIQWDPARLEKEIIKNKEKLCLFKNRRRLYINIIAGNEDVQGLLQVLPIIFSEEHLAKFQNCPVYRGRKVSMEDVRISRDKRCVR
jgi:hypothetical protein